MVLRSQERFVVYLADTLHMLLVLDIAGRWGHFMVLKIVRSYGSARLQCAHTGVRTQENKN